MPREKETFRLELEQILTKFGGKHIITSNAGNESNAGNASGNAQQRKDRIQMHGL